jgi:hypothetical protein
VLRGQALHEQVLRPVRVLVFIHHQESKLLGVSIANALRPFKEFHRLEQQVVEIERVGVAKRLDVELVQLANLLLPRVPGVIRENVGPLHPVLGVADA